MLHALPGMGADQRMFPHPWIGLPDFVVHNWAEIETTDSIRTVAEEVCWHFKINDGDSLIGASLGGIVACEITKIRRIQSLYLVGSATHRGEINRILDILHPLVDITPIRFLQFLASSADAEVTQMFAGTNPRFIRNMCHAVFAWEGHPFDRTKLHRIHGRRDLIIPAPATADLMLDGGHLISLSHARDCVDYISRTLPKSA